jgi:heptosyltransferase II
MRAENLLPLAMETPLYRLAEALVLHPRRLLVRGVNWIGDAVMTTPALQRLRRALPDAHIALLTQARLADLWHHHPCLDATVSVPSGLGPWSVARRLRALDFDAALVLPNSPRAALEAWLARIPHRIGYARPWRNWFLTQPIPPRPGHRPMRKLSPDEIRRLVQLPDPTSPPPTPDPHALNPHQIHDYLHLAAVFGASPEPLPPQLAVTADELEQAKAFLASRLAHNSSGKPSVLLGLNPGAEYGPAKRWPADQFAAVARQVSSQVENSTWLLFGTAADAPLCSQIAQQAGGSVLNLAGQTSLRELMALLKLCLLLLANDTGPMHLAAALGTPVVVPFGSTSPELTGPGLPGVSRHHLLRSAAPCSPCFLRTCPIDFRCMTGITPARVTEAIFHTLAGSDFRL